MNIVYFLDEENNDHDDNSINLPREKDLYITFITSPPKLGKNTERNSTQNNVNVAPKLQMDNIFFLKRKNTFLSLEKRKDIV